MYSFSSVDVGGRLQRFFSYAIMCYGHRRNVYLKTTPVKIIALSYYRHAQATRLVLNHLRIFNWQNFINSRNEIVHERNYKFLQNLKLS